ncbi:neurofilament medium polypeptide-like [Pseudochaenichthys georgianus]|uniref:neurofilament medium polypeptide-like n=1 Tax=Pseudochaenichthys georgianus TaxID=52239 RepID=UPI0039C3722E
MEETELEGRAHPPPATLAAGFSKMGKGRYAGGGGSAFAIKGHCESTTEEGREEDEQSAGEGPSGKGQNKGGENHEKGSGDGKDDGSKDGKLGKKEGKGKEGIGKENVGDDGGDVFRVDFTVKVFVEGGSTKLTVLDVVVGIQELCGRSRKSQMRCQTRLLTRPLPQPLSHPHLRIGLPPPPPDPPAPFMGEGNVLDTVEMDGGERETSGEEEVSEKDVREVRKKGVKGGKSEEALSSAERRRKKRAAQRNEKAERRERAKDGGAGEDLGTRASNVEAGVEEDAATESKEEKAVEVESAVESTGEEREAMVTTELFGEELEAGVVTEPAGEELETMEAMERVGVELEAAEEAGDELEETMVTEPAEQEEKKGVERSRRNVGAVHYSEGRNEKSRHRKRSRSVRSAERASTTADEDHGPGCSMPEIWDIEDSQNVGKVPLCTHMSRSSRPHFTTVFSNDIYKVLKVSKDLR